MAKKKAVEESKLNIEEITLFALLSEALTMKEEEHMSENYVLKTMLPEGLNLERVLSLADAHKVTYLLFDVLNRDEVPEEYRQRIRQMAQAQTAQSFRNLYLTKYLVNALKDNGIFVQVLKGAATATYYPVPTLRKSGDVDLILADTSKLDMAVSCLKDLGLTVNDEQVSHHHVALKTIDDIEVELHTALVEAFDDKNANEYIEAQSVLCKKHTKDFYLAGVTIPGLDVPYHAYELLLHMLQHFLRSGFGLKLLCDWVCFWNKDTTKEEQEKYLELVDKTKIRGFSNQITSVCCKYLGLDKSKVAFMGEFHSDDELFLAEILEAEEFGKSSKERMVALRGNGLFDYIREFHHQMHLNFPRAGKFFLTWPVLWCVTLARFLKNNRKLRKTDTGDILRKAGQRGAMIKDMRLFKK